MYQTFHLYCSYISSPPHLCKISLFCLYYIFLFHWTLRLNGPIPWTYLLLISPIPYCRMEIPRQYPKEAKIPFVLSAPRAIHLPFDAISGYHCICIIFDPFHSLGVFHLRSDFPCIHPWWHNPSQFCGLFNFLHAEEVQLKNIQNPSVIFSSMT